MFTAHMDVFPDTRMCEPYMMNRVSYSRLLTSKLNWRTIYFILLSVVLCTDLVYCQSPAAPIEYHINEELPAFTRVGNVIQHTGLDDVYNQTILSQMQFSLSPQRNPNWNLFAIDNSGILRTTESIDRDKICAQAEVCAVNLRIIIQPIRYFRVIKVTVHIEDRNDNPPTFPRETIQRSVVETASIGTAFPLPGAEDLDSGSNGIQSYHLNPQAGIFTLEVEDSPDGGVDLRLILQGKLDREKEETYTMWVTAVDGGQPELTGSMLVQVLVTDANDNNPKFVNDTYTVMIPENIPLRTTILQVLARDRDVGRNGQVIYALSDATQEEYGALFGIDPESGELFIKGEIDYEATSGVYQLTIVATDRGDNSLPAYCKVYINVEDLNDHAPVVKVNTLTPSGNAQISEGSAVGIFVAHIQVEDPDGGQITCSMDNDYFSLQEMYNSEYKVVTKAVFDREDRSEYHINLICHDRGQPPLTSTKHIVVTVTDENDHPPVFTQPAYTSTIAENNAIGAYIIQVTTTDQDLGRNAAVIYQLQDVYGDSDSYLTIDRVTGIITAQRVFDREIQVEYKVDVVAVDQGSPKNSATASLIVTVLDENDNPPVFDKDEYKFSLLEHQRPVEMEIGRVTATDLDLPPYSSCIYKLTDTNDTLHEAHVNNTSPNVWSDTFTIDPRTGVISTTMEVDREVREEYLLTVTAYNEGFPTMNTTVNVTVRILDLNDNVPTVTFNFYNSTLTGEDTIQVSNSLPRDHVVAAIFATDGDTGVNGEISYRLVNSSDSLFRLDVWTGEVIVNVDLHRFTHHTTDMMIMVSDHGTPPHTAVRNLTIIVNQSLVYLPPPAPLTPFWSGRNIFAVCIGATFFVILLLICIAVVIVKKRQACKDKKHTYNCRLEAEKTESTLGGAGGEGEEGGGKHNLCFEGDLREPEKVTVQGVELGESCTDETWTKAQDNPYILDSKPVIEKEKRRGAGRKGKSEVDGEDGGNQRHLVPPQQHPPTYSRLTSQSTPLKEMELQVQDMLHILLREKESPSETGSYTDSGKGPSEEGDHSHSWPDCHMDGAKGMSSVAEAHSLALTDTPRHSTNYDNTDELDTNRYQAREQAREQLDTNRYQAREQLDTNRPRYEVREQVREQLEASSRYLTTDEGIYVTAVPREEVYASDPHRRAYDNKLYSLESYPGPTTDGAPSYTPPPSYQDSLAAQSKRVGRFSSYTHRTSGRGNTMSLPRTLSDTAGSRDDTSCIDAVTSHSSRRDVIQQDDDNVAPPGKLSKWGNNVSLHEDNVDMYHSSTEYSHNTDTYTNLTSHRPSESSQYSHNTDTYTNLTSHRPSESSQYSHNTDTYTTLTPHRPRDSAEYSHFNDRLGAYPVEGNIDYPVESVDSDYIDREMDWSDTSQHKSRLERHPAERIPHTASASNINKNKKARVQFWDEGPVDKCVHDIVARYIPDKSDRNNVHSVDGYSDDDATTESGSYVIDPEMYLKNKDQKETYVDYIIV